MIGFLGPEGSFTHAAAQQLFGKNATLLSFPNITSVFRAIREKSIQQGVVPIENSTHGVVRESVDQLLLSQSHHQPVHLLQACSDVVIEREIDLPIRHHLLARPNKQSNILPDKITSHSQALAQCKLYLDENFPNVKRVAVESTAAAAAQAAEEDNTWAIGSELAAYKYGLETKAEEINDCAGNTTRFIAIGTGSSVPSGHDRTTFVFTTPHQKGALLSVLQLLADAKINLTRIESRPILGGEWEYCFVVEVEGHQLEAPLEPVLRLLLERKSLLKLLGSYPISASK